MAGSYIVAFLPFYLEVYAEEISYLNLNFRLSLWCPDVLGRKPRSIDQIVEVLVETEIILHQAFVRADYNEQQISSFGSACNSQDNINELISGFLESSPLWGGDFQPKKSKVSITVRRTIFLAVEKADLKY